MLFAQRIKEVRIKNRLLQKELAIALNIDIPMYSRIERGGQFAKREQVIHLSSILNIERDELLSLWIADRINAVIGEDKNIADKALKIIVNGRYGDKNNAYADQWR